jgi:hypothetical protein
MALLILLIIIIKESKNHNSNEEVFFELKELSINHMVDKREGCDYSNFKFKVMIYNYGNRVENIYFNILPEICEENNDSIKTWLLKSERKLPLALISNNKIIKINPKDSLEVLLKCIHPLTGKSLSKIIENYIDFINEGNVVYINKKDTIFFKKTSSFNVKYFLDNKELSKNDSLSFNKTKYSFLNYDSPESLNKSLESWVKLIDSLDKSIDSLSDPTRNEIEPDIDY